MPGVLAQDRSTDAHKFAIPERFRRAAANQAGIVIIRNEADFLRVGLVEDRQLQLLGQCPNFGLLKITDWKQRVVERRRLMPNST